MKIINQANRLVGDCPVVDPLTFLVGCQQEVVSRVKRKFVFGPVGLSMMSYRLWERKEDSFGGLPVERPHGEVVILPLSDSQLFLKILKGIEGVAGIEFFIVLSMTALHFPVVPGGVGLNELMPDAELLQGGFKERFLFGSLRVQAVREF